MSVHTCQTRAQKSAPPAATSEKVVRYHREGDITPPEYEDAIQDPPVYYDGSTPTRSVAAATTTDDEPRDPAPAPSYGCRSSCNAEHACRGKLLEQYLSVDVMMLAEEEDEEKEEEEDEADGEDDSDAEEWRQLHDNGYIEMMVRHMESLELEDQRREEQRRRMMQGREEQEE
ncbi:hypothetical protein BC567DRAFT_292655 [Phyllosticta citribraziliensis]